MNRSKRALWALLFIFVIWMIILGIFGYLIYDYYFAEEQIFEYFPELRENVSFFNDSITEDFPDGVLFYPNLRFANKKIFYSIDSQCGDERQSDVREAFSIL